MGNHPGKDNIGHTGSPLDFFHTPPSSPSEDAQLAALASASSSVFASTMQSACGPCPTGPPPGEPQPAAGEWALISVESQRPPETSASPEKGEEEEAAAAKPRGTAGALSPAPAPASAPWSSPAEHRWQERDSGLESPLGAEQMGPETSLVMLSLMEYYRASLGLSPGPDDAVGAVELLRRLVSERGELVEEVKGLKETLRVERAEWRQFQRDLQVAVSVADRLRADAEQALGALREHHGAAEARLVRALSAQREQDRQLRELQAQHRDARRQLSTLQADRRRRERTAPDGQRGAAREGAGPEEDAPGDPLEVEVEAEVEKEEKEEEEGDNGKGEGKRESCALVTQGKDDAEGTAACAGLRAGADDRDAGGHCEARPGAAADGEARCRAGSLGGPGDPESEKTRLTGKGVAEAYILSLAAMKKKKEAEAGSGTPDQRRVAMLSERSWSLSRLPLPDNVTKSSPSPNSSATLPLCKKEKPLKAKKTPSFLQRQDSWSSFSTKKQEPNEDQNSDSVRPQDSFSVLLRRHGGSRRNALLRWCQSRTQGYKNIEITNFTSSWEDGLAFCAVFHTYLPSHIPYVSLTPEDKKGNLDLAFQTGNSIGITATLTVEEMLKADGPNWQSVLGYVEGIFRHFEM